MHPVRPQYPYLLKIHTICSKNNVLVEKMKDGEISADGEIVGRIAMVDFKVPDKLQKTGDSLFVYNGPPEDQTIPMETSIRQGTLEQPNISTALEMVKMINIHRMYEAYQKMIQTFDEIDSKAILEIGKL